MLTEQLDGQLVLSPGRQREGQLVAAILHVGQLGRQLNGTAGGSSGRRGQPDGNGLAEEVLDLRAGDRVALEVETGGKKSNYNTFNKVFFSLVFVLVIWQFFLRTCSSTVYIVFHALKIFIIQCVEYRDFTVQVN